MYSLHIDVTQEDIDKSIGYITSMGNSDKNMHSSDYCTHCPVAEAINRVTKQFCDVSQRSVTIYYKKYYQDHITLDLPISVGNRIMVFDQTVRTKEKPIMEPFSFSLFLGSEIPKELLESLLPMLQKIPDDGFIFNIDTGLIGSIE